MVEDAGRRRWLAHGLWLLIPALDPARAGTQTVRFAVSDSWAPPYVTRREGVPVGGLLVELMRAIAAELDAPPRFVRLPSQRADAAIMAGDVDLHCLISPDWYGPAGPPGRLGPPMVPLEDVLVMREAGGPIDLTAQRGLRVGTVLGYGYQGQSAAFASGALRREDAQDQQRMLEMLRLGRTDAAISDRRVMEHFNRSRPEAERLHARQVLSQTLTHACLSPRSTWPEAQLLRALERVVASGTLRRLLAAPV